jgi:hypothetical protein
MGISEQEFFDAIEQLKEAARLLRKSKPSHVEQIDIAEKLIKKAGEVVDTF